MELFSELYGAYYSVVADVIALAVRGELSGERILRVIDERAFAETALTLPQSIRDKWRLITPDYATPIKNEPLMPLTLLQKRWLKAISLDPRFTLFGISIDGLNDVRPLFKPDDIYFFDKCGDGDPYTDSGYIERFRSILDAVKRRLRLNIEFDDKHGKRRGAVVTPVRIEYSEKDDKFRLITAYARLKTINLARLVRCEQCGEAIAGERECAAVCTQNYMTFELIDERRALERAMLHFAHFKKETEKTGDNAYRVRVWYDVDDEKELVIRVLSFGPMIKAVEPSEFVNQIRERLHRQIELANAWRLPRA